MEARIRLLFGDLPHRHYGSAIVKITLLLSIVLRMLLPDGSAAYRTVDFVITGAVGLGILLTWSHARGKLCDACFDMPLNIQEKAEKQKRWFGLFHFLYEDRRTAYRTVLCMLSVALLVAVLDRTGWHTASELVRSLFVLAVVLSQHASDLHRKYQPWCPRCRRGRGDDDESPVDTPDPAVPVNS